MTHTVEVDPERVSGWFSRFAQRNGGISHSTATRDEIAVTATNGTVATATVPFAPLVPPDDPRLAVDVLVLHLLRPRRIGLLLVRLGGHSIGIAFDGKIVASRTNRRPVHSRTSAGGQSQSRFARRRENQARQALQAAAVDAHEVLTPHLSTLDGIVLGGDTRALATLRTDPRLAEIFALAQPRILNTPNPNHTTLTQSARRARTVEIVVTSGHDMLY